MLVNFNLQLQEEVQLSPDGRVFSCAVTVFFGRY